MSDEALKRLARAAGLYVDWTDANGRPHEVKPDTLRNVLDALGYPANTQSDIADSQRRVDHEAKAVPPLIAAQEREAVHAGHATRALLRGPEAEWRDIPLEPLRVGGASFRAPDKPGYYELQLDDVNHVLAVAPQRCYSVGDAAGGGRIAGVSAQIYSLRNGHSTGIGDFAALGGFAAALGALGVDAVGVSPTHARFSANPGSISPYTPSSRFFLDPIYADLKLAGVDTAHEHSAADLIDWQDVHRTKYAQLRAAYEDFLQREPESHDFQEFCREGGERLFEHALFEALDSHFRGQGKQSPREWPAAFRDPKGAEVRAFAERERKEIAYHQYLQWITDQSASAAQARAREKMAIGLIADMAVGVDRAGSHMWSAPNELVGKLSIGAPPDIFNSAGQDWGLTTYSPSGLRMSGYESFLLTLRAGMRNAGGIRIDHAMGLRRLWVLPDGASPVDGVYVSYPLHDLLRLIALESVLHKAIVIGEDLGTVPEGFRAQIAAAGILGMRVLWFERTKEGRFIPPERWESHAAALTTTHDLPTVVGWWRGRDIEWAGKLKRKMRMGSQNAERRERKKDRNLLWSALAESGCARGPEPSEEQPDAVLDGALSYVSRTPCVLAMAAAEDVLGVAEQPNLPGTIDEHPNWRRRLPEVDLATDAKARARIAKLVGSRHPS